MLADVPVIDVAVKVPETDAHAVVSVWLISTLVVLIVPSTVAFSVMDTSPTTVKLSVSVSTIKLVAETVPAKTVPVVVKPVVVMVPVAGSDLRSLFEVRLKFPSLNWMTPFFPEADALPPPSKELSMELILLIKHIKTS